MVKKICLIRDICGCFNSEKKKKNKEFKEGGALLCILTHFPSDYQHVRLSAPPPKQLCFLGGGALVIFS